MATDLNQLATPQKRQLLAELLQKGLLQPKDRPLSIGQERLHRLAVLYADVPLYNVAVAYRIKGLLNIEATEKAVRRIAERHEILRTTFPLVDGKPVQRIAPPQNHSAIFVQFDLGVASDADRPGRVAQVIQSEIARIIDIIETPPWRVALLRVAEQEQVLVLTMHHIVTDGWSVDIFLKELAVLYRALHEGEGSPLSRLSVQYSEWAERQRGLFADEAFKTQQRYWASQLAGPIPALRLPTGRQKSDQPNRAAASSPFTLSNELLRSLALLSQRESATLFMIMLAGFAALLNRSTHQQDLLLCTPVIGRHRFHSKELIGYFNNILPMRLDLSGDPSLLEVVQRTRRVAIDAYNNQDVPFQWNADLPSLRRFTLSRVLFSLDMEWPPRLEMAGVTCEPIPIETGAADFDLSISLWRKQEQILGTFRFKQDIFDEDIITKMGESYREVLSILAKQPERKLSSLPSLGPAREEPLSVEGQSPPWTDWSHSAHWSGTALEQRLVQEWEDELEQRPIGIHDHLHSLGVSSLAVAALAVRIQTVFKTEVSITEIFQAGTIKRMAALLQSHNNLVTRSPLAPIQPNGTKPPLFLCEGVGIYYPLIPYLGNDQPIYGLFSEFEADYPRVEDIAAHFLSFVRETQTKGPYYLGGVSIGGLVAFEMAQQLHAIGEKVGLVALMDTPGPDAYRLKTPARRALGHASNLLRYGYPYLHDKIEKQFRRLKRKLSNREIAKANSALRLIADVDRLRSLFGQSAAGYEVKPYAGRITLFMLTQRSGMSNSLFDPALGIISPSLGWESVAAGGVERYELSGGHVEILQEPFVRALGERLRQCLDREQSASAGCI